MGIKWEDVKVRCTSVGNRIVIGKTKKDKSGVTYFKDKSGDMTEEVVRAVAEHMLREVGENGTMAYDFDGICELRVIDLRRRGK